jgi:hypothetical protein
MSGIRYKCAFLIVTCVHVESVIVARSEPTIIALRPMIVKIFPVLLVRV